MSRLAHASGATVIVVITVASINAEARQPSPDQRPCIEVPRAPTNADSDPAPAVAKRQRIRSLSETVGTILDQGFERSPTFRRLVEVLEESPVLVYIEPGRCPAIHRQRLNGCFANLGTASGARHLRIMVDIGLPTETLIATVGHELQHAVEARASNAVAHGHREAFIGAAARPVGANVYETDAAQDVEEAIRRDLRRTRTGCAVTTGAVPPA